MGERGEKEGRERETWKRGGNRGRGYSGPIYRENKQFPDIRA